jgi:membrane protein YdbS with pleckstrin-like domain
MRRRNTAPAWKKVAVVLSAPVAVLVVMSLLDASSWSFLPFAVLTVAVAAAAVWLVSRLLGVHLSLRSWD